MQAALNIVKLGPGLAEVKSVDYNAFIITTSKKEYRYDDKTSASHFMYPRYDGIMVRVLNTGFRE